MAVSFLEVIRCRFSERTSVVNVLKCVLAAILLLLCKSPSESKGSLMCFLALFPFDASALQQAFET